MKHNHNIMSVFMCMSCINEKGKTQQKFQISNNHHPFPSVPAFPFAMHQKHKQRQQ